MRASPLGVMRCPTCNGTSEVLRGERNPNVPWETREWTEACPNDLCRGGVLRCNSCGDHDAVAVDADGYECCADCLSAEACDSCDGSGIRSFHVSSESDSWAAGWDGEEPCRECEGTGRAEAAPPVSGAGSSTGPEARDCRDVFPSVAGGTGRAVVAGSRK